MNDIDITRPPSKEMRKHLYQQEDVKNSLENFQKNIHEVFEKNGIMNDLRAYLRRHIVDILKSSQAGDTPLCQKHFSERLELKTQAMNILVAEYLMCMECSYTLSVFVSEIPLANMVFDFASNLMRDDQENNNKLRFQDKDVLSIINYLGIKCDSNIINNILDTYNEKKQPLLLVLLKCVPTLGGDAPFVESAISPILSDQSIYTVSSYSLNTKRSKRHPTYSSKCQHHYACKSCQARLAKLKDKYNKKVKEMERKEASRTPMKVQSLIKNIDNIESSLINEMFGQLKSVYESEAGILRDAQERRMREAYMEHATSLQAEREEMEEAFRAREEELERGVRAKKKFLWGLARSLREQHEHLARAMAAVKYHTHRLREREENVKSQLSEVEHLMKTQSKEMEGQISHELIVLEEQLEKVRREREGVCREREQLEQLKIEISISRPDMQDDENEAMPDPTESNYNLLRSEIKALRAFVEMTQEDGKTSIPRFNTTETNVQEKNTEMLNNEQDIRVVREDESRLKNNQVVNDFKKQKNVNFSMINMVDSHTDRRIEGPPQQRLSDDTLTQLRQENERLKEYARQKEQEVYELSSAAARLQAELVLARGPAHTRPCIAPAPAPAPAPAERGAREHARGPFAPAGAFSSPPLGPARSLAWRCGGAGGAGGEDTTVYGGVPPPRVFLPGDPVPFIGLVRDRHSESKRLMNQWRMSRRTSPVRAPRAASPGLAGGAAGPAGGAAGPAPAPDDNSSFSPNENINPMLQAEILTLDTTLGANAGNEVRAERVEAPGASERDRRGKGGASETPDHPSTTPLARDKSPKSVLREAKERLRTSPKNKIVSPPGGGCAREKSPSTVLREAKLRLRKLEIEAEAVERSYNDYRKRQSEMRSEREQGQEATEDGGVTKDIGDLATNLKSSLQKSHKSNKSAMGTKSKVLESHKLAKSDLAVLLREFRERLNLNENQFCNRNTAAVKVKPIPDAYSPNLAESKDGNKHGNYLETPLVEFRKNYRVNEAPTKQEASEDDCQQPWSAAPAQPVEMYTDSEVKQLEAKKDALIKAKNTKKQELEILKKNISRIYNILDDDKKAEQMEQVTQDVEEATLTKERKDTNLLRIEVENTNDVSAINVQQVEPGNIMVMVQSAVETSATSEADEHPLNANMTILISPKRSAVAVASPHRSLSPEQAARLTRNDVLEAIFHADHDKISSNYEVTDDTNETPSDGKEPDDYPDDFSADVDNYNHSRAESPASHDHQHSRSDPFWDDSQIYS